jgi:glycosyltransferase involved in cell wall biosynthesis
MSSAQPEPARWPSVTVILPTLGERADLLEQALDGISSQDYPGSIECLVVLDVRSPDAGPRGSGASGAVLEPTGAEAWQSTRKVAAAAGARVLENKRTPGLAGSRNTGIVAAAGELVAFCDDDDCWLPGKLRAQVAVLAAAPEATLVCCGIVLHYGDTVVTRVHPATTVTFRELLRSRLMALHVSTFVARRSALLNGIGMVSEEIPGSRAEDYEFILRIARHGPVLNVPQPAVRVLWHTQRKAMWGNWPVVAKALPWLLDRYPEFQTVPAGYARIAGQVAFAAAAYGDRSLAWKWARKAIRANPREARPYIALGVAWGFVKPGTVVRALHRRGKGL